MKSINLQRKKNFIHFATIVGSCNLAVEQEYPVANPAYTQYIKYIETFYRMTYHITHISHLGTLSLLRYQS